MQVLRGQEVRLLVGSGGGNVGMVRRCICWNCQEVQLLGGSGSATVGMVRRCDC